MSQVATAHPSVEPAESPLTPESWGKLGMWVFLAELDTLRKRRNQLSIFRYFVAKTDQFDSSYAHPDHLMVDP